MPVITLRTHIHASPEVVFDLSRSVDLHQASTAHTGERAVAGVTSGLMGPGDTVTWWAKHFGIWQNLSSRITAYDRPRAFTDEMVKGAFHSFSHQHIFRQVQGGTEMTDVLPISHPWAYWVNWQMYYF